MSWQHWFTLKSPQIRVGAREAWNIQVFIEQSLPLSFFCNHFSCSSTNISKIRKFTKTIKICTNRWEIHSHQKNSWTHHFGECFGKHIDFTNFSSNCPFTTLVILFGPIKYLFLLKLFNLIYLLFVYYNMKTFEQERVPTKLKMNHSNFYWWKVSFSY